MQADRFWVPHPADVWSPCSLSSSLEADPLFFLTEDGDHLSIPRSQLPGSADQDPSERLQPVQADQLEGVEDICTLMEVSEGALLHTIRLRYNAKTIYTRVLRTLIAVNPFMYLPIYSAEYLDKYMAAADSTELPPHIFSIGHDAITGLKNSKLNQAVLISGESGAGKTESAKLVLSYVAEAVRDPGASGSSGIESRVLQTNPVLEAFGNAMTVRNNNSSRFGKWLDLRFNNELELVGSHLTSYLLETTRVCNQASDERGFHVFFQVLKLRDTPEFKDLNLKGPKEYVYLKGCQLNAPGIDDAKTFQELKDAFDALNFLPEEQASIFRVLAGILSLGNCVFGEKGEYATFDDPAPMQQAADHLRVPAKSLSDCMLLRKIVTGRDVTEAQNRVDQANGVRDGLARLLYGRLFLWLVARMNEKLTTEDEQIKKRKSIMPGSHGPRLFGVLDIAGFECFAINSLEQLLINLSNEHLQQHFNQVVFKAETEECAKEGVSVPEGIGFIDNADCLALIDGKGGILDFLDETVSIPKATDTVYVNKIRKEQKDHPRAVIPKIQRVGFGIKHFAGEVDYSCEGWLVKNMEQLPAETTPMLKSSELIVLQEMGEQYSSDSAAADAGKKLGSKKVKTVSAAFRRSLRELMEKIHASEPHYVRCVKPNMEKVPGRFTARAVLEQLLFSGVLAAVRIRQEGYAYRLPSPDFIFRYGCITQKPGEKAAKVPQSPAEAKAKACAIVDMIPAKLQSLGHADVVPANFAVGHRKVFVRLSAYRALEDGRRHATRERAIKIQSAWRGKSSRVALAEMQEIRQQLRELLAPAGLLLKANPRRGTANWEGTCVLDHVQTVEKLHQIAMPARALLAEAGQIGFCNVETLTAGSYVRRMEAEAAAIEQLRTVADGINPSAIEKALARHEGLKLPASEDTKVAKVRLTALKRELPLIKVLETAIAARKAPHQQLSNDEEGNDPELDPVGIELLQEAMKSVANTGLAENGHEKWLEDTGGARLYLDVQALLAAHEKAKDEAEERRTHQAEREANAAKAAADAERLAADAAAQAKVAAAAAEQAAAEEKAAAERAEAERQVAVAKAAEEERIAALERQAEADRAGAAQAKAEEERRAAAELARIAEEVATKERAIAEERIRAAEEAAAERAIEAVRLAASERAAADERAAEAERVLAVEREALEERAAESERAVAAHRVEAAERHAAAEAASAVEKEILSERIAHAEREAAAHRAEIEERTAAHEQAAVAERMAAEERIRMAEEAAQERHVLLKRQFTMDKSAVEARAAEAERIAAEERGALAAKVAEAERLHTAEREVAAEKAAEVERIAAMERDAYAQRIDEAEKAAEEHRAAAIEKAEEIERVAAAEREATAQRAAEAERHAAEAASKEEAQNSELETLRKEIERLKKNEEKANQRAKQKVQQAVSVSASERATLVISLRTAADEYNADELEVLLQRATESGMEGTSPSGEEDEHLDHGIDFVPGSDAATVAEAQGVLKKMQADEFLERTLRNVEPAVVKPDCHVSSLRAYMNLTRQLKKFPGHSRQVSDAFMVLQRSVACRPKDGTSSLNAPNLEERELAQNVFKKLDEFGRLKTADSFGGHRATMSMGKVLSSGSASRKSLRQRPSVALALIGGHRMSRTLSKGHDEVGRKVTFGPGAASPLDLGQSFMSHSKACIVESLTGTPFGQNEEEYEAGATQNFRNINVWMRDRPAQEVQRVASKDAVVQLASAVPDFREEIFCQVLKQLNGNPTKRSAELGWDLLRQLCLEAPLEHQTAIAGFVHAFLLANAPDFLERTADKEWAERLVKECRLAVAREVEQPQWSFMGSLLLPSMSLSLLLDPIVSCTGMRPARDARVAVPHSARF